MLLVEAGGRDTNPWIHVPVGYYRTMFDPRIGWGYETAPIPGTSDTPPAVGIGQIDDARILAAESEPGNWLAYGRTYEEQRFSPLTQINRDTVEALGLAWSKDMGTNRALEATPIVVDGIMFFTSTWSRVHAVRADTGETVWDFDPQVPREWGRRACCLK